MKQNTFRNNSKLRFLWLTMIFTVLVYGFLTLYAESDNHITSCDVRREVQTIELLAISDMNRWLNVTTRYSVLKKEYREVHSQKKGKNEHGRTVIQR